jgi:hypothetical protein
MSELASFQSRAIRLRSTRWSYWRKLQFEVLRIMFLLPKLHGATGEMESFARKNESWVVPFEEPLKMMGMINGMRKVGRVVHP